MPTLQLEGAYHMQDLLFERGIRTLRQLASLSVEHVRALPCSNGDKTALLNASRTARIKVATDDATPSRGGTGEGFGDANVALLTSRGSGGFLPLFSHRIEKVAWHVAAERDLGQDLREAVGGRDLDAIRRILATREGKHILNHQGDSGWTVLQRACVSRRVADAISSPPRTPAPAPTPKGQHALASFRLHIRSHTATVI